MYVAKFQIFEVRYDNFNYPTYLRTCSISSGVIVIFHGHNHSGHTVALGSNRPLKEMSTRNIS